MRGIDGTDARPGGREGGAAGIELGDSDPGGRDTGAAGGDEMRGLDPDGGRDGGPDRSPGRMESRGEEVGAGGAVDARSFAAIAMSLRDFLGRSSPAMILL
jgi:hypothetical protein